MHQSVQRFVTAAFVVLVGVGAGVGSAASAAPAGDAAVVRTTGGLIHGTVTPDHRYFGGIPYAAPPTGELRWRPPRPARPWTGVRDATRPGSECPQSGRPGQPKVVGDEDCLYLNVTTPVGARPGPGLPVLVWLHGGGFTGGAGSDYDPTRLVTTGDVIVVTINYRLGALGFLDLPELAAQDPDAGDFALADQQSALRWVHGNAGRFGGDPANVTIFGQSAGGYAVCANLAAPGSRGLFAKAIVESGPCGNALATRQVAEQHGVTVATGLGCVDPAQRLACLRATPAAQLVGAGGRGGVAVGDAPWVYSVGGPALPEQPLNALLAGRAARVPLIQGSTHDEMTEYVAGRFDQAGAPLTAAEYPDAVRQMFGDSADAIVAEYPVGRYPSPDLAFAAVLTDWGHQVGACPVLPADDAAARREPVYAYEFAQDDGLRIAGLPAGAAHGSELPYLFDGSFDWSPPPTPDTVLSGQLIRYWTRFARTGDPNGAGTPDWPAYRGAGDVLSLAAESQGGSHPVELAAEHHCAFWFQLDGGTADGG